MTQILRTCSLWLATTLDYDLSNVLIEMPQHEMKILQNSRGNSWILCEDTNILAYGITSSCQTIKNQIYRSTVTWSHTVSTYKWEFLWLAWCGHTGLYSATRDGHVLDISTSVHKSSTCNETDPSNKQLARMAKNLKIISPTCDTLWDHIF